jgi:hypothetical protein
VKANQPDDFEVDDRGSMRDFSTQQPTGRVDKFVLSADDVRVLAGSGVRSRARKHMSKPRSPRVPQDDELIGIIRQQTDEKALSIK